VKAAWTDRVCAAWAAAASATEAVLSSASVLFHSFPSSALQRGSLQSGPALTTHFLALSVVVYRSTSVCKRTHSS